MYVYKMIVMEMGLFLYGMLSLKVEVWLWNLKFILLFYFFIGGICFFDIFMVVDGNRGIEGYVGGRW